MKAQFIQALKNGQCPFQQNQQDFEKLLAEQPELFQAFNSHLTDLEVYQHRWNASYFSEKSSDLDFNFSEKLVSHLIEVKKYLQEKGEDPRFIVQANENSVMTTEQKPTQPSQSATISVEQPTQQPMQADSSLPKFAKPNLAGFQLNERLTQAIKEDNLPRIRSGLMSLLNNRRLEIEDVVKSIWSVYQQKPAVFEQAEDSAFVKPMDSNETSWNFDYFNVQQVYLNYNFTLERLLHLVNVRETLMKKGDKDFQQIEVKKAPQPQSSEREASTDQTQRTSSTEQQSSEPKVRVQQENKQRERIQRESESRSTHQQQASSSKTCSQSDRRENTSNGENQFVKTALLVGGAVLAVIGVLFAMFK